MFCEGNSQVKKVAMLTPCRESQKLFISENPKAKPAAETKTQNFSTLVPTRIHSPERKQSKLSAASTYASTLGNLDTTDEEVDREAVHYCDYCGSGETQFP